MPKITTQENETDKAEMSNKMLLALKNKIKKYGFYGKEYVSFLVSVGASKPDETVIVYPNSDIDKYREAHVKEYEESVGDAFQLDKFKIKSSDKDGKQYETGWFSPRGFWDSIKSRRIKR